MSEPWSIEAEARRLCGCGLCEGRLEGRLGCDRSRLDKAIRAGLVKAAEVAAQVGPMNQSDSLDAAARIRALLGTP